MAISKVTLNGTTLMDVTQDTVATNNLLTGETATGADGEPVTGAYVPPTFTTQEKSVSPTESKQVVTPSSGYDGLSSVTVEAVSSTYVGSGITRRSSSNLTASGATVTVPAGYYSSQASKSVSTTTHPKPTVSLNSTTGVVTASHAQTTGYVTGGTTTETLELTTKAAATITPSETQQEIASGQYLTGKQTIAAIPSTYVGSGIAQNPTPTASGKTVTIPAGYYDKQTTKDVGTTTHPNPTVSINSATGIVTASHTQTAGYVSAGTTEKTLVLTTKAADTITPSETAQEIAAGQYLIGKQTIAAIPSDYVGSGITVDPIPTASGKTVTIPAGYYSEQTTKDVATVTQATPSVSINSSGLITATATQSAGYVSAGTKSGTKQMITKSAETIHPSTNNQIIESEQYLTGTQTIAAVKITNLFPENILSGVTIKVGDLSDDDCVASVAGSAVFRNIYQGESTPSASIGNDGDVYVQEVT